MKIITIIKNLALLVILIPYANICSAEIYGDDTRRDYFELDQSSRDFAEKVLPSIVMITYESNIAISADKKYFQFKTKNYLTNSAGEYQPVLNELCTGVLVAPDLVATARHCRTELSRKVVVRGYQLNQPIKSKEDLSAMLQSPQSMEMQYRTISSVYAVGEDSSNDFILLKLSSPFPRNIKTQQYDFLPVEVSPVVYDPNKYTNVATIGYSSSMPLKFTIGEHKQVLDKGKENRFATNLDISGGNSGGPVFINHRAIVAGLISGQTASNIEHEPLSQTRFGETEEFFPLSGNWVTSDKEEGYSRELAVQAANFAKQVNEYLSKNWPSKPVSSVIATTKIVTLR